MFRSRFLRPIVKREKQSGLLQDQEGASLLEYTVLVGIITVAAIAAIGLVGTWVGNQWTSLSTKLPAPTKTD